MKYLKKKRSRLMTSIAILGVLLTLLLVLLLWLEFGPEEYGNSNGNFSTLHQTEIQGTSEQELVESTENSEVATTILSGNEINKSADSDEDSLYNTGKIETPYLTLYFDDALADHLTVVHSQGTPYILEFYVVLNDKPEQRIFDIRMGDGADGNLGIIETDIGKVPVSMVIYSFSPDESWTQDEINTVLAMLEGSNDLIDQLMTYQIKTDYQGPERSTEEAESNISNYVAITTPFCTLPYPAEWEAYLQIEQTEAEDYRVMFYGDLDGKEPVLLFTLIFGGDYGEQLGAVKDGQGQYVTVNILLEELAALDCSEEDMTILYKMQEAVNQIIAQMPLE